MISSILLMGVVGGLQPTDTLIFVGLKLPVSQPPMLSVQSLHLGGTSAGKTDSLLDIGDDAGGLFMQVSALVHGSTYIAGLQESGTTPTWLPSTDCAASPFGPCVAGTVCCSDPASTGTAEGACYRASSCAALHGNAPQHGLILGYDLEARQPLFRFNGTGTPICWHLAVDHERAPGQLLCLRERGGGSAGGVCTNYLVTVDMASGATADVGAFPSNLIIGENDATYDANAGVYYALLAPPPPKQAGPVQPLQLCGMDIVTGRVVSQVAMPETMNILNMDFDPETNLTNAVIHNLSYCDQKTEVAVAEYFGRLDPATAKFTPVGAQGIYAARGYNQINSGFGSSRRREYLMTAFKINATTHSAALFLVGTDMDHGGIVYEYQRPETGMEGNFIDMALYTPTP